MYVCTCMYVNVKLHVCICVHTHTYMTYMYYSFMSFMFNYNGTKKVLFFFFTRSLYTFLEGNCMHRIYFCTTQRNTLRYGTSCSMHMSCMHTMHSVVYRHFELAQHYTVEILIGRRLAEY
jgi:hypothetical protein